MLKEGMKLREKLLNLKIGDKVFWKGESIPLTVRAKNERFIIVARPIPDNFEYSIIDTEEMICGPDDRIFGVFDYLDPKDCAEALKCLSDEKDDFDISYRNRANCIDVLDV
ncbi:hypothetical protein [Clostridium novyi]|uniref:hypothetical protein n=1 Tax=Clostridium novyi TaxID=1542 RepID=UPI00057EACE8|nr:hypothetical protein [Clostridium novyi]